MMRKALCLGAAAAITAAVVLASPASAWDRRFIPPPQFHPNFAPQFHPGFAPRFEGGPRWVGGGGYVVQPGVIYCYDAVTGALYHYGPCDGTEGQVLLDPNGGE